MSSALSLNYLNTLYETNGSKMLAYLILQLVVIYSLQQPSIVKLVWLLESDTVTIYITASFPWEMHSFLSPSCIYQVNSIPTPFLLTRCIFIPSPFPLSLPVYFRSLPFSTSISIPYSFLAPKLLLRLGPN